MILTGKNQYTQGEGRREREGGRGGREGEGVREMSQCHIVHIQIFPPRF